MTVPMTELQLTAAEAGYLRIVTGVETISNETVQLCVDFVKHYAKKGVFTKIKIFGPMSDTHYDNVITTINLIASMTPEQWEARLG